MKNGRASLGDRRATLLAEMQASTTDVLIGVTTVLRTFSCVIALAAMIASLPVTAQADTLALRCEGTKITTERKEPDWIKEIFPKQSAGEEDKGTRDARREERASTDVIVTHQGTDQVVYAFGTEFDTGFTNDAFVRFGSSTNTESLKL